MIKTGAASDTAVVMAAYNAEATIIDAVASVVNGSLPVDLFVVDDASASPAAAALAQFDGRINVTRLDRNLGPAGARNAVLRQILARGYRYVAIMDADDIAYPARFAKQRAFLEQHPDIAVCGAWVREFDGETGRTLRIFQRPATPDRIRKAMFFNIAVAHPSAMFRGSVLNEVGLYSPSFSAAEDYELMRRINAAHAMANLQECLLDYRIWPGGMSQRRRFRQLFDRLRIQMLYLEPLNWRAWAGLAKTLLSLVVSDRLLQPLKLALSRLREGRQRRSETAA